MESNWAEENLQTIRTLMERSAVYRRALAPVSIYVGCVGVVAAAVAWVCKFASVSGFLTYWMGVSLVAIAGAFIFVRRQALHDGEPVWSPPTRRVAQAMFPALLAGMVLGVGFAVYFGRQQQEGLNGVFIFLWTLLYGLALHSAGFFIPRGIKLFGWVFIAIGTLLPFWQLVEPLGGWLPNLGAAGPNVAMGLIFGGLHLAYGIYLYFTEPRKNEA